MHRASCFAAIVCVGLCLAHVAPAHDGPAYPRVRTFSGGYYGPTQAHYQYQRQYGRPWHGQNGLHGGVGTGYVNGYPAYSAGYGAFIGGWGYPVYGGGLWVYGAGVPYSGIGVVPPLLGYGLASPWSGFSHPDHVGFGIATTPSVIMNPVLSDAWEDNLKQWEQPIDVLPVIASGKPALPPSTPAARVRSIQLQAQGDFRLHQGDCLRASIRYREAISAAADRSEPHLHLAIALAGMKQFDDAVHELKVGLALDPAWPASGVNLDGLLGEENFLIKDQLKRRVAEWTLHDVRDPDRLFLLGALLYLDSDPERGRTILETAARLGGLQEYFAVFLRPMHANANKDLPAGSGVAAPEIEEDPIPVDGQLREPAPELPPVPAPAAETVIPVTPDQDRTDDRVPEALDTDSPTQPDGPVFPQ